MCLCRVQMITIVLLTEHRALQRYQHSRRPRFTKTSIDTCWELTAARMLLEQLRVTLLTAMVSLHLFYLI